MKKSGDDYALVVDDDGDWFDSGVLSAPRHVDTPSRPRHPYDRVKARVSQRRSDDPDNQQHKSSSSRSRPHRMKMRWLEH